MGDALSQKSDFPHLVDHVLLLLVDPANISPATTINFITFIGAV